MTAGQSRGVGLRTGVEAGGAAKGRWWIAGTLSLTLFVAYLDRLNISLALPLMARDLGWSAAETERSGELLFALFYLGYGLANILLSPLAQRLGGRTSLTIIIVLWTVFTALGALFAQLILVLAASRILLGLSEGVHFPVMNALTRQWFAPSERGRASGLWIAGLYLAVLLSPVLLVPLMERFGWRAGFLGLAAAGLLVALPAVRLLVRDRPAGTFEEEEVAPTGARLRRAFGDRRFVVLLAGGVLNNVVALGFVSWLPTFLVSARGLPYADLAWAVSLPYAAALGGIALWAWLGDRTRRRALVAAFGYGAGAVALFASLSSDDLTTTLVFYALGAFLTAAYPASEFALLQEVLPNGSVAADTGLYNGLSTMIGGGAGPFVISAILERPGQSATGLFLVPGLCLAMAAILLLADRTIRTRTKRSVA